MSIKIETYRHEPSQPWTYADLDRYQRQLAPAIAAGESGRLIFSEVAPVITLGKRNLSCDLLLPESEIQNHGIEIYRTDRGGRATYHGPGQWVVFYVEKLEVLTGDSKGVRKAVEKLLNCALRVSKKYFPQAEIRGDDQVGVWTEGGAQAKKLVSLGIKIENGVVLHGLCFNGYPTAQSFFGIEPCGLNVQPGYLIEKNPEQMESLAELIRGEFRREFTPPFS